MKQGELKMEDYDFDQSQVVSVKTCKGSLEQGYSFEIVEYLRENPKRTIHSFWKEKLEPRVRGPSVMDLRGCENNAYIMGW